MIKGEGRHVVITADAHAYSTDLRIDIMLIDQITEETGLRESRELLADPPSNSAARVCKREGVVKMGSLSL